MNRRSKLVLIAVIYGLAVAALLLAGAVVAGLLPFGAGPTAGPTQIARAGPASDAGVPTLRPIWPPDGSAVPLRRSTRTPTPTRRLSILADTPAPTVSIAGMPGPATPASGTGAPSSQGASLAKSPLAVPTTPAPTAAVAGPTVTPGLGTAEPEATAPGPSPTASATVAPAGQGRISGRIMISNAPPPAPLQLTLENQSYQVVARTTTGDGGSYAFSNLPDSAEGYNVVFSQDLNPDSQIDKVATWAWLGPVPVRGGQATDLPAFDITLMGFQPSIPAPDGMVSGGAPVRFNWAAYPGATEYWLDLSKGDDLQNAWQSPLQPGTSATWDGTVNGARSPDTYWWSVGARRPISSYMLVIYSYLVKFSLQQ